VSSSNDLEEPSTSCQPGVTPDLDTRSVDGDEKFCFCNGPDEGSMICCDNDNCKIMWFLLKCLKMSEKSVPKGKW